MFWRLGVALILAVQTAGAAELELISRHRMVSDYDRFGGISGIEVIQNGRAAHLVSDRGRMFHLRFERGQGDDIVPGSVQATFAGWMGGDSEGIAYRDGQNWFVSYEQPGRIDQPWRACFASHPDFAQMPRNEGLEALAIDSDGRLVTLSEGRIPGEAQYKIYRYNWSGWEIVRMWAPDESYLPVGADFGPDGQLYVLERSYGLSGFRNQVRRVDVEGNAAPERIWRSGIAAFDNLEGISLWRDVNGETRVTMVADDNFWPVMRGELVEFILRE